MDPEVLRRLDVVAESDEVVAIVPLMFVAEAHRVPELVIQYLHAAPEPEVDVLTARMAADGGVRLMMRSRSHAAIGLLH